MTCEMVRRPAIDLAVLWAGPDDACLSHDTALHAWGIADVNPDRIHLAVPRGRRLRRAGGGRYVLHHEDLQSAQVTWWQGIRIVTVPTAIGQSTTSGLPTYLIRQAVERSARTSALPEGERERLLRELQARDAA